MDLFLMAIHHIVRNGGTARRLAALRKIRKELAALRKRYVSRKRIARLERLDYLADSIDFVLNMDAVVMLVASGEQLDKALAAATRARDAGDPAMAAVVAAETYTAIVEAGMKRALNAFARKLSEKCDWGVLTTLNVKVMPKYWQEVAKLEAFLPARPPRDVTARGQAKEVWVSWETSQRFEYDLYRRKARSGQWQKINKEALKLGMFVDRPGAGAFEYAVTATEPESGFQSPRSHTATAVCGPAKRGPHSAGCRPYTHVPAGKDVPIQVIALSDRGIGEISIVYRQGVRGAWKRSPMAHRFRDSYHGCLPGGDVRAGMVQWYVEAVDEEGNSSVWPAAANAKLPWSLTVT
jgi:hypothetical protein